ncbi:MAG: hypothetical protein ACOCXQ_03990 [Patescibacteria group bacterium]
MSRTSIIWPISMIFVMVMFILVSFMAVPLTPVDIVGVSQVEAYPIATSTATSDQGGTNEPTKPWPAQKSCGSWMYVDPDGKGRAYPAPNPVTGTTEYGLCLPLVLN